MEMPSSLLQSELFGHLKGAFTGAARDRAGLIESADGGTFFLDEIGEMPLSLQAALLRVLQEKEVRRIGESRRRRVDVRFIFATNRNLAELVCSGAFREDLYFRVNGVRLTIPPLSQRREDIIPLAEHFLAQCRQADGCSDPSGAIGSADRSRHGRPPGNAATGGRLIHLRDETSSISVRAAQRMLSYQWPGNVRELKNEIERIVAFNGSARKITPRMLSPHIGEPKAGGAAGARSSTGSLPAAVERLERQIIRDALELFGGNRTRTAQALGVTRQGLLKKIKRYGLVTKNR
jgi:transcriptional regulator with PAS, ATPase and Fis domain